MLDIGCSALDVRSLAHPSTALVCHSERGPRGRGGIWSIWRFACRGMDRIVFIVACIRAHSLATVSTAEPDPSSPPFERLARDDTQGQGFWSGHPGSTSRPWSCSGCVHLRSVCVDLRPIPAAAIGVGLPNSEFRILPTPVRINSRSRWTTPPPVSTSPAAAGNGPAARAAWWYRAWWSSFP